MRATRNEPKGVYVSASVHACAGDFATIVDGFGELQIERRIGRNKSIQVEHRAVLPQEGTYCGRGVEDPVRCGCANNLRINVNRGRIAATIAAQDPKVRDALQISPQSGVECVVSWKVSGSSNFSPIVDCVGCCETSSQRAAQFVQ